jgi:hypothetical protein
MAYTVDMRSVNEKFLRHKFNLRFVLQIYYKMVWGYNYNIAGKGKVIPGLN